MEHNEHLQLIREAHSSVNRTRIERNTSGQVFFMWLILWAMFIYVNYQFFLKEYWGTQTFSAVVLSAFFQAGAILFTVMMYKEWSDAIEEHYWAKHAFNRLTYKTKPY